MVIQNTARVETSMTRPRLLIVSTRYPFPVIGGDRLRIVNIAREFAQSCDVDLLCLATNNAKAPDSIAPFSAIHTVPFSRVRGAIRVLHAALWGGPLQVALYGEPAMYRTLEALTPDYDAVIAHLIRAGQFVRHYERAYLEMTDALSMNYERTGRQRGIPFWKRFIYRFEGDRVRNYEDTLLRKFTATFVVSKADQNYLLSRNPQAINGILVAPNGVELLAPHDLRALKRPVIGFIGSMGYLPNIDACKYFVQEVLPILRARMPDLTFRIIGRGPAGVLRGFAEIAGVEVTGEVPSIEQAMRGCFAGVAPIRIAAGLQNKVLEYMAMGVPAVISDICSAAIGGTPGRDLMVAADAVEFAAHLSELWNDSMLRCNIGRSGHLFVKEMFSWSSQLAPIAQSVKFSN